MPNTISTFEAKMDAAAKALDFEDARRCRDMISLMRGGGTAAEAEHVNLSGVKRQQLGSMGLGNSRQQATPLAAWRPSAKPNPMTTGRSSRKGRRRP